MFVCVSEQTASQPTKRERKPEGCEDVLQDLLWGKAQPDTSKVARNKSCWGLCWVSIVPLALSAPRQEVTLAVCRFTTFLLKSKLFQRKGEMRIKHKHIKKQQCEEAKPYTLLNIAIKSFLRCPQKWVGEAIWVQLDASLHSFSKKTTYIKIWFFFWSFSLL